MENKTLITILVILLSIPLVLSANIQSHPVIEINEFNISGDTINLNSSYNFNVTNNVSADWFKGKLNATGNLDLGSYNFTIAGIVKIGYGVAANPSLAFTSDPTTGIFRTEDGGGHSEWNFGIEGVSEARISQAGFDIKDSLSTNFLQITPSGTAMTSGRTLTIDMNDAARTIDLTGNPTLGDWFDGPLKDDSDVTFNSVAATTTITAGTSFTAGGGVILYNLGLSSPISGSISMTGDNLINIGNLTAAGTGRFGILNITGNSYLKNITISSDSFYKVADDATEVYLESTSLRLRNLVTSGGWARGFFTYENSTGSRYFQLAGKGVGQELDYVFIGPAYTNAWQYWDPQTGNAGFGTTTPDQLIDVSAELSGSAGSYSGEPAIRLTQAKDSSYQIGDVHSGIEFFTEDATGDFPGLQAYIRVITTRGSISQADAGLVFGTSGLNDPVSGDLARDVMTIAGDGGVHMPKMKSGTDQADAGADAGELYFDTNDDNTVKMGV